MLRVKAQRGFTLVEMLVSIAVLALITVFVAQLVKSAATITTLGNKHMDADTQVRQLFDRMALDFAQIVKRNDVEYNLKFSSNPMTAATQSGSPNDRMTFFATVPGDFTGEGSQSPISLIAYRVNFSTAVDNRPYYTRLQRMARGMLMNGVNSTIINGPIVFGPTTIAAVWPSSTYGAVSNTTYDSKYELAGPQVFRFEYYYMLNNGQFSTNPYTTSTGYTSTSSPPCTATPYGGLRDVTAVVVAVAVIDPKSRVLLTNTQVNNLAATLVDYPTTTNGPAPGYLLSQWQTALNGLNPSIWPRSTISAIRLYERYFYLPPTSL